MYALLVDLSDAVAEAVQLPKERISMEMVLRGLYHFNHAYNHGHIQNPIIMRHHQIGLGLWRDDRFVIRL